VRQAGAQEAGKDPESLEFIVKVRCSVAKDHAAGREALSRVLTFYSLADFLQRAVGAWVLPRGSMPWRAAWENGWLSPAARALISDRLFNSVP